MPSRKVPLRCVLVVCLGLARGVGLREEVDRLEARERALQNLYAEMEKSEAEGRVAALEERVMEEEKLNKAALTSD